MEDLELPTLFITHDVDEAILLSDRICILGRPVDKDDPDSDMPATITDIITIEGREKKTHEYLLTEDFLKYKRKIIDLI